MKPYPMDHEGSSNSPKVSPYRSETDMNGIEELEFDGNTVLCRVCGDRASGFHYGVHACEGCKGFFRRSIQQKIQYRPCLKNQLCLITRVNRNRCQYCRLKKCIAVGMSRDAVRFGRVPKREKAKIMEQMQKVNVQCHSSLLDSLLCNESEVQQQIVDVHMKTCDFTRMKFRMFYEKAWSCANIVHCPARLACPLNPSPELEDGTDRWGQFSDCFMPAIRNVVTFAKCIPGFSVLSQEDQVILLKAGTFEVLLVHLACLFDSKSNTMIFTNGKIFKRTSLSQCNSGAGYLLDSVFDFAERFNPLDLLDEEIALFSALVIVSSDRPGLRGAELVERLQTTISRCLQDRMKANHQEHMALYEKLLVKIPELRMLNTVHSEKLLGLAVPSASQNLPSFGNISDPHQFNRGSFDRASNHAFAGLGLNRSCDLKMEPKREDLHDNAFPRNSSLKSNFFGWPSDFIARGQPPTGDGGIVRSRNLENHTDIYTPAKRSSLDSLPPLSPLPCHTPGASIIAHQISKKAQSKEVILTTPFGTFHRTPLSIWPNSDSVHVPRESGDISNEFEMDYNEEMSREGNGKPRKKFKQSMENDRGMLPMSLKKKVMRTWSEDSSNSKLTASSSCTDNTTVSVGCATPLMDVPDGSRGETNRVESCKGEVSCGESNVGGVPLSSPKTSSMIDKTDSPALKRMLSVAPSFHPGYLSYNFNENEKNYAEKVVREKQAENTYQRTSPREMNRHASPRELNQRMSPGEILYQSRLNEVQFLKGQPEPSSPNNMDFNQAHCEEGPQSNKPKLELPSKYGITSHVLEPSRQVPLSRPVEDPNDHMADHVTTMATLKNCLRQRINSRENVNEETGRDKNVVDAIKYVGMPGQAALPTTSLMNEPYFPLNYSAGVHPAAVLYSHLAMQQYHVMQQFHAHLNTRNVLATERRTSLQAAGSPLHGADNSEHLTINGSVDNRESKHLDIQLVNLARNTSYLLKSELS